MKCVHSCKNTARWAGQENSSYLPTSLLTGKQETAWLFAMIYCCITHIIIVVPESLQWVTLQKIHSGHLGIEKCKKRTVTSVWWPGVMHQITQLVHTCRVCAKECRQGKEPMMTSELPKYPWQVVGADLFELNKSNYLLVVDYFSRYQEVLQLTSTTSASVISALKSMFLRHGIPEIVRSDNRPQYSSAEFMSFASSYGFQHLTSSPKFPQSNGQSEWSVHISIELPSDSIVLVWS